ncbi:hypothetical protein ERX46_00175 [Brumimicrobium glaciale]|uniref:T9SS type A sorting domain-containing protein n=1 Tax=Brumimicrobium glaciale TaxID=200475 RepID=A0A4Q4KR98_9FLAO|nr:hypothetical protein [Brumimicrobium glaciale]RYM35442.1 hypothetical protein ERX46_00175 [Brumimicrobium glaciale]
MRQLIITFYLIFIVGFGAVGQYDFTAIAERSDGVTLIVKIKVTGVYFKSLSWGCEYAVEFNTSSAFYENDVEMVNNVPQINDLNIIFECNPSLFGNTIETNIPRTLGDNIGQRTTLQNTNISENCDNISLENLMSTRAILLMGFFNGAIEFSETITTDVISTLPVELITFDAVKQNRDVKLSWKTASELNNDYFTVDRSADGISWETIQTLSGAGNSSHVSDYSWLDVSPYSGISYYRLKQTDYDGKSETFNIVSVVQNEVEELQAYPNPVSHSSTLLGVDSDKPNRIFNTVGVEVTGNVNISHSPYQKTVLDMSNLPTGLYYVTNGEKSIQLSKE